MTRHHFEDELWAKLYAHLRMIPNINVRNNEKSTRSFVEGVNWILRTGAPWRDLPSEFGKWNTIFKRFEEWSKKGIWEKLHQRTIEMPDMEWLLMDSTVVRSHACAAGSPKKKETVSNEEQTPQERNDSQALGRSVGGFSTKIHVVVDSLGNPLRMILTGGQKADSPQAISLLIGFEFKSVLADRGYDSNQLLKFIAKNKSEAVIPSKKNRIEKREIDKHTYKDRHLVECFMNKIKHCRRIFSRFDKYACQYMGFLSLISALIWLK